MVILDTDVLSALIRLVPQQAVLDWLDRQSPQSIWTTAITLLEVRFGIAIMPSGKRRSALEERFERLMERLLKRRIAEFNAASAEATAAQHAAFFRPLGCGDQSLDLHHSMISVMMVEAARRAVRRATRGRRTKGKDQGLRPRPLPARVLANI